MNVNGKKVLLTGATGGIGQAFAQALANKGAQLIIVSRSPDKLDALITRLPGSGHTVVAADLGADQGRQAVVAACSGGVDILINNAGVNRFGLLQSHSEQQLRDMFELNTLAPILLTQALLPQLRSSSSCIVNIGSGFGSIGFAGYCGYSASKFALRRASNLR